jgi:hypothetical protein
MDELNRAVIGLRTLSMKTALNHRSEFLETIAHIRSATNKVMANAGNRQILSFPDAHKISEGLFLSAVTHWEELCQILLITDLVACNIENGIGMMYSLRHASSKNSADACGAG